MAEGQNNDRGIQTAHTERADGNTPLHTAALTGNADLIRELLEGGSEDLEERNARGQTPLYLAVLSGNDKAVKRLLEAGADLTVTPEDGTTIWHAAALAGIKNIRKILTEPMDILKEEEGEHSTDSEGGEFKTHLANRTSYKAKLENDYWNIFVEAHGPDTIPDLRCICQIEENQDKKKPIDCSQENTASKPSELFDLEAYENAKWKIETALHSDDSEQEVYFMSEQWSPPSHSVLCNLKECDTCLKDFVKEDDVNLKYSLMPKQIFHNDEQLPLEEFNKRSCNSLKDVASKVTGGYGRPIIVRAVKRENKSDQKNSETDNKKLINEERDRNDEEIPCVIDLTHVHTQTTTTDYESSEETRDKSQQISQRNISTDNKAADGCGNVLRDITDNKNNEDSEAPPKSITNYQRRNRQRRHKRKKENTDQQLKTCKSIIDNGLEYARYKLNLLNKYLGPPVNENMKRERVCSTMREFFACQKMKNVDVDSVDEFGRTLLHHASAAGAVGAVEKLIRAGSNVNLPDKVKVTPMLLAALSGAPDVVEALALAGAAYDTSCTPEGESALHAAARYGHHRTVKKLLELGADPNATDGQNKTPLDLALSNNCALSSQMLKKYGARVST